MNEERSTLSLTVVALAATPLSSVSPHLHDRKSIKRLANRIHKHACGHAQFSHMRELLQRNNLWNEQVQHYISYIVTNCVHFKAYFTPPPNRQVSLSFLSREFNKPVAVGYIHLEDVTILNVLDTATRYSAASVVESTDLSSSIY